MAPGAGQTHFAGDFTGFVKAYTPIINYAMCTPVRAAVITGPSVTFQLQAKHYKNEKQKQSAPWHDVHINLPSNWSHPTNFDLFGAFSHHAQREVCVPR